MLTLLLALSVSQAPLAHDLTPPPMTSAGASLTRSARLVSKQPRVSTGALIGKLATATAFGLLGSALGVGVVGGVTFLALTSGSYDGVILGAAAFTLALPIAVGLGILGVAVGAAFFGDDFGKDFGEAMTVAGLAVPMATALAFVLILLSVTPVLAIGVSFLAATLGTPLLVQALKPMSTRERSAPPLKDEVPTNGVVFQL